MKKKLRIILASILVVALSSTAVFAAGVPEDVAGTDCEKAVEKLMEEGVITGDIDGMYHPEQNLSRAQISVMIARAIDPTVAEDQNAAAAGLKFSDMEGYDWAAGAVGLMAERGFAKGYPDGTFKPGNDVSVAELITFVMRAAGYDDEALQGDEWPYNYINEAKKLGIFSDDSGKDLQKTKATKEQAALIIYNTLDLIKKEAQKYEAEQAAEGFVYGNIDFDSNLTTVNGKALAADVKIYPYEKKSKYSKDMELPDVTVLGTESVYKYKNVSTVGFYKVENNKVTEIILPKDVGFSGKIYGVINEANFVTVKDEGDLVELATLAAGKEINWLTKNVNSEWTSDNWQKAVSNVIKGGYLMEMKASKGRVTAINSIESTFISVEGTVPMCLGDTVKKELYVTEKNHDRQLLKLSDNNYIAYGDNTIVYELNEDMDAYEVGSMSDVKKGCYVRAYDITDNDIEQADIIIVSEKKFYGGRQVK